MVRDIPLMLEGRLIMRAACGRVKSAGAFAPVKCPMSNVKRVATTEAQRTHIFSATRKLVHDVPMVYYNPVF